MALSSTSVFCILCMFAVISADTIPVLMWGTSSASAPALNSNAKGRFLDAVKESQLTLAFVEEALVAEDISMCTINFEGTCFNYLSGLISKSYTQVSQPLETIEEAKEDVKYVNVDKDGKLDSEIPLKGTSIVIFNLANDPELNHDENLEKHDAYIRRIYNDVASRVGDEKVLGIYTGASSGTLIRKARQATANVTVTTTTPASTSPVAASSDYIIFQKPQILIYYTNLTFTDAEKNAQSLSVTSVTVSNVNASSFSVSMAVTNGPITFNVQNGPDGYWNVTNIQYGKFIGFTTDRTVGAADGFSYYCGPATSYTTPAGQTITFLNLQMEPTFNKTTTADMTRFNDPYNCVGFTSIPIWSGLFVTVVLLLVLSAGITWLMDIKTMDRFDDPKGKTITVGTGE